MKGKKVNWNQVYYFTQIAAAGSLKIAAQKLEISPSTLSEHIKSLEETLRVTLFNRDNRAMTLTPAGLQLFQSTKPLFDHGQRMVNLVSPLKLGIYPIMVGIVPSSIMWGAHKFLKNYISKSEKYKIVCTQMSHRDVEKKILDGMLDFAFSHSLPENANIKYRLIMQDEIHFFVSQTYQHLKFHDAFAQLPLFVCQAEQGDKALIETLLDDVGIVPFSLVVSDNLYLILELVSSGGGIVGLPSKQIERLKHLHLHSLKTPKSVPEITKNLYLLWATHSENLESIQQVSQIQSF